MKTKTLLSIFLVLFCIPVFASFVSLQTAEKVAIKFYYEKYNQYEGAIDFENIQIKSVYTSQKNSEAYYYAFQFNIGGFVIVPADDCLGPVLGYSFKHNFVIENQPLNLKWWLQQYENQVMYAQKNQLVPAEKISKKWAYYLKEEINLNKSFSSGKQIEPLITSLWDQDAPYNLMCPEDPAGPGGHALSGCVATAYAQMLYYWRFPLHGTGYHCYNHPAYGELCADFENTWYRWGEMCDEPESSNTAVAELMYQVGVAVEMNYGPNSSGAYGFPEEIEPWFKISTDYDSLKRDYYTTTEWTNTILDQLNQACPVGYIGFTSNMSSGHMWICDGYQDSTHFHMNWGWSGSSNGYFTLDNLQGFNTSQYIGINFYPDDINYAYPNYATGADTCFAYEGSICDGSGPVNDYMNNTEASWLIDPQTEIDSVTNITLMVQCLDLANDGDKLLIYDGGDNSASLLAELSGSEIPDDIVSSSNKLFIEFISNSSNTAPGFYLNYKTEQPDWCGGMTPLNEPATIISDGSGSFYYYNLSTCQWLIDPGTNEPLTFYFNYFDTEEESDRLKFYDAESQEIIAEISGSYEIPPEPITIQSGKAMLVFLTNGSVRADGWELWYDIDYVGVSEEANSIDFSILPNPCSDNVQINFNLQTEAQVNIQIYNLIGEEEGFQVNKTFTPGAHSIQSNLGHLPEGLYFIRFKAGSETITKKIIKTK